MKCKQVLKLL